MAVGREEVEAAVEVVVEEEQAELQRRLRRCPQSVEVGQVGELQRPGLVADVERRHLVGEVADRQAEALIVEERAQSMPMPPRGEPDCVERHAAEDRDLLELPAPLVVEEEVLHGVIGHRDIDEAVPVHVVGGDA